MAARSLLLDEDVPEAWRQLDGAHFPDGVAEPRRRLSAWLNDRLRQRLNTFGAYDDLKPVPLGSWARGELCPKSDVDLIFNGDEAEVSTFIARAMREGLKLRARVPADPADWAVGVEAFDLLAMADAGVRPVKGRERARILSAVRREREQRRQRQDSVPNYLEPNLKFGAGGLRDIEQALALARLYEDRFANADPYPFTVLTQIKEEFLFLRAHLHLLGSGDTLTAADQLEIAPRLNFAPRELMRIVQSEFERASFYADWVVATCAAREPARPAPARRPARVISDLKKDPGILRQFEVRRAGRDPFKKMTALERGRLLKRALAPKVDDRFITALHRTRVLERFLPELKALRGLVSHDHYHRYAADAHLVQALRETQRVNHRPRTLGPLAALARELSPRDWWVLKLTALFHDLAKGRGGDHSTEGAKLATKYLRVWGYPASVSRDVVWLVEHHLALSTAAFRQNPASRATWRALFERGVEGRRLTLLAVFTAIDIRATNPEAWTAWKAQLLKDLVDNLRSPRARHLKRILNLAPAIEAFVLKLDPALLEALDPEILSADVALAARPSDQDLPILITRAGGRLWVRFHRRVDRAGLFLEFVQHLFGFGLSVQMCFVHTLPEIGVYDWFCIKGERTVAQVGTWLRLPMRQPADVTGVTFDSVEVTARNEYEWILSCRGPDQRGLLVTAARALSEVGLSIRWARVHTWGRQVEDVFGLAKAQGESVDVATLRLRRLISRPTT